MGKINKTSSNIIHNLTIMLCLGIKQLFTSPLMQSYCSQHGEKEVKRTKHECQIIASRPNITVMVYHLIILSDKKVGIASKFNCYLSLKVLRNEHGILKIVSLSKKSLCSLQ